MADGHCSFSSTHAPLGVVTSSRKEGTSLRVGHANPSDWKKGTASVVGPAPHSGSHRLCEEGSDSASQQQTLVPHHITHRGTRSGPQS
jgi:hypothetical protein